MACYRLLETDLGYSRVGTSCYCIFKLNYELSYKAILGYSGDSEFIIQDKQCRKIAGGIWAVNYPRNLV